MKKRIIATIAALVISIWVVSAFANSASDVSGTWHLLSIQADGKNFTASSLGLSMTLTLNVDGSASFIETSSEGTERDEGRWTANGSNVSITLSGDAMSYQNVDGQLVFRAGSDTLTFTKDESTATVRAQEISASDVSSFLGDWSLYAVLVDNVLLDAESEGIAMELSVKSDEASFTFKESGSTESSVESFTYRLNNGRLEAIETSHRIAICDDGTLHLIITETESGQSYTVTYCLRRAN